MTGKLSPFNLKRWIDAHRDQLKPPIGAQRVWQDGQFLIMVIGGPNARRDFHIDPSDEFFLQLEGDMVLECIDAQGKREPLRIREGEVLLLPANTPHSPQRPAHSVGLVVERIRAPDEPESYAWYCEQCDGQLYKLARGKGDLLHDLRRVAAEFNASEALRTCKVCAHVQAVPSGPRV